MGVASAFSGFRVHLAVLVFHKGLSISGTLLVFVLAWLNRVSLKIKTLEEPLGVFLRATLRIPSLTIHQIQRD